MGELFKDIKIYGMNNKYIITSNLVFEVPKTGTYYITGVGGGGGGTVFLSCGGGSGRSCFRRAVSLSKNQLVPVTIGTGGAGVNKSNSRSFVSVLTAALQGESGGSTIFGDYVNLSGGQGGFSRGSDFLYYGGDGESSGELYKLHQRYNNTFDSYVGGSGGNSLFGPGGIGGFFNYSGSNFSHGQDAISYGAGGAGGGTIINNSSGTIKYSAAGDGRQGILIVEFCG